MLQCVENVVHWYGLLMKVIEEEKEDKNADYDMVSDDVAVQIFQWNDDLDLIFDKRQLELDNYHVVICMSYINSYSRENIKKKLTNTF